MPRYSISELEGDGELTWVCSLDRDGTFEYQEALEQAIEQRDVTAEGNFLSAHIDGSGDIVGQIFRVKMPVNLQVGDFRVDS